MLSNRIVSPRSHRGGDNLEDRLDAPLEVEVGGVDEDDPIGGDPNDAYHMYFNLTTEKMEELHHTTENSDFPGPQCNGTRYSYTNYFSNAN